MDYPDPYPSPNPTPTPIPNPNPNSNPSPNPNPNPNPDPGQVGNLWKGFFGAVAALVCFQLMADFEIFYVPETRFVWLPHVGWEYYFFVAVGVLQGLFSALLVRMIAGTSRWLRGRGLLKTRRFACGLSVCSP